MATGFLGHTKTLARKPLDLAMPEIKGLITSAQDGYYTRV
jgi:hypothetical protein